MRAGFFNSLSRLKFESNQLHGGSRDWQWQVLETLSFWELWSCSFASKSNNLNKRYQNNRKEYNIECKCNNCCAQQFHLVSSNLNAFLSFYWVALVSSSKLLGFHSKHIYGSSEIPFELFTFFHHWMNTSLIQFPLNFIRHLLLKWLRYIHLVRSHLYRSVKKIKFWKSLLFSKKPNSEKISILFPKINKKFQNYRKFPKINSRK